jgi:signal transduction histidine kinase
MDMGRMYIDEEKISVAKFYLDSALYLFNELDEPIQLAETYELYGILYMNEGAYEAAANNFYNSYAIWKQNAMPDTVRTSVFLGKLFFLKHAFPAAQTYLQTAYTTLRHQKDYKLLSETLLYLAKTDSALGNAPQAYKHWNEYKTVSDSFYARKMNMQVQEMMLEYEIAKKEKENQLLKYQTERFKERLVYTIIIAVLLLAAIIFLLVLNYQKKKMNRKLQFSQLEIQRAYNELKEALLLKDKLFSIIAHDLRVPLANTKSILQLTQQGLLQKEEFENISKELSKNLEHSNELLDNLLHWAKSQMQGIQTEIKKIFVRQLVTDCFQLFEAAARKKKLCFENHIADNCIVLSDENILRLALRNALSNAVKFSFPNGKIIVSSKQTTHYLQIFIQDFGKGISEDNKHSIFSLRAVSTDGTHHEKGSGIGLKITMEMLHKVNGKISLESALGQGTTVCISLPS